MKKLIGITLITVILAACATTTPLHTPSGRPEVTIQDVTRKQVMDAVVSEMLAEGMQIRSMNEYGATFGKRTENFMAMLFFGSRYDSFPEARTTFNVVDAGDGVRVFANVGMVTNPGSAFERTRDLTNGQADTLQKMLVRLKSRFDNGMAVSESGVANRVWLGMRVQNAPQARGALIADINQAGPAERAGLHVGDIVVEFNGSAIPDADAMVPIVARTNAGQRVPVKVLRNGETLSFDVQLEAHSGA